MNDADALISGHGTVEELAFSDEFLDHLRERAVYKKHQVALEEILQVHGGKPRYFLNTSSGRAPIIMAGPTAAGRYLCVPIEPAGRKGVWIPVTAFEANRHHIRRYQEGLP